MGCHNSKPLKRKLPDQQTASQRVLTTKVFLNEAIAISQNNIYQHYKFEKLLGSGKFGIVKLAVSLRDNYHYAVKTIPKNKIHDNLQSLYQELSLLRSLDHPNIVRFYEIFEDEQYVHFVMEYCSGGDLFEKILKSGSFPEAQVGDIMKTLFQVISYLHFQKIIHRDLKPENILISSNEDANFKLIDFGLSKICHEDQLHTQLGTPVYVAPEILDGNYGLECDNWALGVIMYVLISGCFPFFGDTNNEIFKEIKAAKVTFKEKQWKRISEEAKDLILQLLNPNPKLRITSAQSLKHPWFSKLSTVVTNLDDSPIKKGQIENQKVIQMLKNYSATKRFKKEALKIILNQMRDTEIKKMHELFIEFDLEKNGVITVEEMKQIMHQMGQLMTENEITNIINKIGCEQNVNKMHINYSEFIAATLDKHIYLNKERLWSLFQYFDTDQSGEITLENLKEVMARSGRCLSQSELKVILDEVDQNQSGTINFEQFCKIMKDGEDDTLIETLEQNANYEIHNFLQ